TALEVGHPGAVIDREQQDLAVRAVDPARDRDDPVAGMLEEIGRELGRDDLAVAAVRLAPAEPVRVLARGPARLGDHRAVRDPDRGRGAHIHRVTLTRVPRPGADSIANSFISRRAPDSPRPRPPLVE